MSQNDFTIANQGFPAFRADLNSALQALASNSSGATAPSTTFANMWWYDSSNNIMYIRNEDNDAWIKFAELDQTTDTFIVTSSIDVGDNVKAKFGDGDDLEIYHNGTDSLIVDTGSGTLKIYGDTQVSIQDPVNGEFMANFVKDGAVSLYYNNSAKLATTSTGIDVTGTVTADDNVILTGTGGVNYKGHSRAFFGSLYSSNFAVLGSAAKADETANTQMIATETSTGNGLPSAIQLGAGNIDFHTIASSTAGAVFDNKRMRIDPNGDISFYEDTGTTPKLFWDASAERLGIGTASPTYPLHVLKDSDTDYNPSTASFNTILTLKNTTSGALNNALMSFATESNGEWYIGGVENSANTASDFVFVSRDSGARAERMRIDSNGEVTIQGDAKKLIFGASADSDMAHYADGQFAFRNTDAQGFVFYTGAGPTERVRIDANGHVTMPNQPAFYAVVAVEQSNIATVQWHTIIFGTERFDQNADFNNGTGVFTAPVTGKYQFNTSVRLTNADTSAGTYLFRLNGSNRSPIANYDANQYATDTEITVQLSALLDMDANDTVTVQVYQDAGTAQTDIQNGEYTFFNGFLAC